MLTPEQSHEELRVRKYARPFVPFEIEFVDGLKLLVHERMRFAATPKTVIVLDRRGHGERFPMRTVKSITVRQPLGTGNG